MDKEATSEWVPNQCLNPGLPFGIIMIGYEIISDTDSFALATGILFLMLLIGFLLTVIVLKALFRRVKAAGRVETVKAYILPEWVGMAVGIVCGLGGVVGIWIGTVSGIINQTFFTKTYPEIDFLVFEPVSIASIVFGTLLILFSACIFALGAFLIIESRLKMK